MPQTSSHSTWAIRRRIMGALHPLSDVDAWDRLLGRVNPLWAVEDVRARMVDRIEESPDTVSLWLKPNRHWQGQRAGQHVLLGVEIDGVRRRRAFSISSAPRPDGLLRLTLQRQGPGGVTEWLHAHAREDMVFELGSAAGSFVLPSEVPDRLLMIAGGSGITPLLAMLHQLADASCTVDVMLVQLYRNPDNRLFADELADLAPRLPGLRIRAHCSAKQGRLDASDLLASVPDIVHRQTFLCGPEAMMADFGAAWTRLGLETQLQTERFGAPRPIGGNDSRIQAHATESKQVFTQEPGLSLLEAAEAAGLHPKFGCRAGLCRTCLCRKRSGRVRNLVTGLVSSQPDEWVQLCVSVAESDIELSL